jgi:hypothetical protein
LARTANIALDLDELGAAFVSGHVIQDLAAYRLPLAPMPEVARLVHAQGVLQSDFPQPTAVRSLWLDASEAYADGVRRAPDGKALITCTTELPGVTPAMIDWWFGWHLPESARYQLWHPKAHLKAVVREDRSALTDDRARYIGNASHVDEYIGSSLKRLTISFHEPASFGLEGLQALGATAICATTVDRALSSEGGRLVHLILPTPTGSVMRSAFWLGEIRSLVPLLGPGITRIANMPAVRRAAINDRFLLDLFQHCSEEMNHLAKFLPQLYRDAHSTHHHESATSVKWANRPELS